MSATSSWLPSLILPALTRPINMSICRILKHVILKNQKLIKSIELNTIQKYGQRMNKMSLVY